MNCHPIVSIVIPVYKVEPYIRRCIDSVLSQTYRQIEVILVDDCTPDNSMAIADRTISLSEVKDMSFKYLRHEQNRGLSAARNTGINAATGEYIYFLDSDDELLPNCIQLLIEPFEKQKLDFVIGNYMVSGTDNRYPALNIRGICTNPLYEYSKGNWYMMAINKLINLQFLIQNGLYFKEGLIHEDELWSFQMACVASNFYAIDTVTYIYHVHNNSIMTTEAKKDFIEWRLKIAPMMWEYIDKNGFSYDITANNTIESFIQSAHPIFILSRDMKGYKYYKQIRRNCCLSRAVYRHLSLKSLSGFVKYSHYLMPVPLGFTFKVLLRIPSLIKEGLKK